MTRAPSIYCLLFVRIPSSLTTVPIIQCLRLAPPVHVLLLPLSSSSPALSSCNASCTQATQSTCREHHQHTSPKHPHDFEILAPTRIAATEKSKQNLGRRRIEPLGRRNTGHTHLMKATCLLQEYKTSLQSSENSTGPVSIVIHKPSATMCYNPRVSAAIRKVTY
jgi:hypothetical protein